MRVQVPVQILSWIHVSLHDTESENLSLSLAEVC